MSYGRGRGTLPAGALGPAAGAGTGTGTGINTGLTEDGESTDPRVAEIGRLARRCMEGTDMGGDVLEATTDLRRLLSTETNPPIRIVVNSGVIPRLVQFIGMSDWPKLQFEAAWAITNVASGTTVDTEEVIKNGGVTALLALLPSPNLELCEQAVWGLGNIAGDSIANRDLILSLNAMPSVLTLMARTPPASVSLIRNSVWTLSNLCRGKPGPNPKYFIPSGSINIFSTMSQMLQYNDIDVLSDVCWGLSYITDSTPALNKYIFEAKIGQRLAQLLPVPNINVTLPTLRTIGNIASGSHEDTQAILDSGILAPMVKLLSTSHKKCLKKECLWAVSNITAGTKEQVADVVRSEIIPHVLEIMSTGENDLRTEAAWLISNALTNTDFSTMDYFISRDVINLFEPLITDSNSKLVAVIFEALECILKYGDKQTPNRYRALFKESLIQKLQEHATTPQQNAFLSTRFGTHSSVTTPTDDVWGAPSVATPARDDSEPTSTDTLTEQIAAMQIEEN